MATIKNRNEAGQDRSVPEQRVDGAQHWQLGNHTWAIETEEDKEIGGGTNCKTIGEISTYWYHQEQHR